MKFYDDTQTFIYEINVACEDIEIEIDRLKRLQTRLKRLVVFAEEYEQKLNKLSLTRID